MTDAVDSKVSDADLHYVKILEEVFFLITDCRICSLNKMSTIKDYVVSYSKILSCISSHSSCIKKNVENLSDLFYKLFLVENFILKYFIDPEFLSVYDVIKGKYENYKFRDELIIESEKYYKGNISTLSCEQDIESLLFKYYKFINTNDFLCSEYVLVILYIRKEPIRFFKIYQNVDHSVFSNRLAIILSYKEDCEFTTKNEELKIKSFIDSSVILKELPDISRLIFLENDDFETWKNGIIFHFDWIDKVFLWKKNRCESSCILDKHMIEKCIEHKRFNDGWTIYKYGSKSICDEFHTIISLCISALHSTNEDFWADRLIEIIHLAIEKQDFYVCREVVQDIFYTLGGIPEIQRLRIVKQFIKEIRVMENNEEIVTYIIKGINELCKKCINTETCDICVEHANLIYKEWKKNNTGGFFFKTHSKYESEIYENMLDMCDTIDDCNGFKNVCKDLMQNEAKINKGIFKKLQTVHTKTCNDCKHGTCHTLKIQDNQQLLNHFLNGFGF